MTRRIGVHFGLLLGLWFSLAGQASAAPRLAVLELEHPKNYPVRTARYLSDLVRAELVKAAPGWRVLTRENLLEHLPPGVDLATCEGDCAVSTGRNVGADAVVSGELVPFDGALRLMLKLHATADGAQLAAARGAGTARAIEGQIPALAARLAQGLALRPAPLAGPGRQRIDFSQAKDGDFPKGYGGMRVYAALRDKVLGAPAEGTWRSRIPLRITGDFALTLHLTGNTHGQQARCTRLTVAGPTPIEARVCPHPDDRWVFGFVGGPSGTLRAAHDQIMPVRILRTGGTVRLVLDDRMMAARPAPAGDFAALVITTRTGPPMRGGAVDGFALEAITLGVPR